MRFSFFLLVLASVLRAHASIEYVKSANGICAGVETECDSIATCTETYVAICQTDGEIKHWLKSELDAVGYVDTAGETNQVTPSTISGNGYRDLQGDAVFEETNATYAYTMTGAFYGSAEQYAYIGTASYLNLNGTITSKVIDVYAGSLEDNGDAPARQTRFGNPYGAPDGPYQACISQVTEGTCGAAKTFTTGAYKFNIYGYFQLATPLTDVQEYGVRVKMTTSGNGFEVDDLKFNGDKNATTIADTQILNMSVVSSGGEKMTWTFPQTYNVGTTTGLTEDVTELPVTVTDTMKIRVQEIAGTTTSFYITYAFDGKYAVNGNWFLYDPDVVVELPAKDTSTSGAGIRAPSMWVFALSMLMAFVANKF